MFFLTIAASATTFVPERPAVVCTLENRAVRWRIAANGRTVEFVDRRTGKDYAQPGSPIATVRLRDGEHPAEGASFAGGRLTLTFAKCNTRAVLKPAIAPRHIALEVVSADPESVDALTFADLPLTLKGEQQEPFAACALALNLQTNVTEAPRAGSRIRAICYPRFGMVGARMAVVACPTSQFRAALQEAVTAAPDIPHSPIGGPWALGKPINQGSYLFNFGGMTEQKAGAWIDLVKRLGMNQIDFHGGNSFRFGDCEPNPVTYPQGRTSLKAVVDRLHAGGIKAGLHTYAFFIDKRCPWVTPVPDKRLAKSATFTLAQDIGTEAKSMPVAESTAAVSAITGFFVRNSATIQIDDELITFTGALKTAPFGLSGCTRGAYGTHVAEHRAGAKVYQLKECFGLFVPDPDTTLLAEVAARTAETFNACGFDMIYLDALDGEDILGGAENGWHYGSKFVFEIWKRLRHPALMEMSTFHHHLWYVRSRMGAWDHPNRSHKAFIDLHVKANEENARMFLPGQLGWWAVNTWSGPQVEPTYEDDIEYLMAKCLGTDTGFALMGIDPDNFGAVPALPRLAAIIKRWEDLRYSRAVSGPLKAKLRQPGADFTLSTSASGAQEIVPVVYEKHRVDGMDGRTDAWTVKNRHASQPLRVRIESLMAAAPFSSPQAVVLAGGGTAQEFSTRAAAPGVVATFAPALDEISPVPTSAGSAAGVLTAKNNGSSARGAWAKFEKTFEPALDLSGRQALGLWVHGDGEGEVLNVQLRSPSHIVAGIGEHYITVDFKGWRYFELVEPEGDAWARYSWPYGDPYSIYREAVAYGSISTLALWLNNLPPGRSVSVGIGEIRALPLVATKLSQPAITVNGKTLAFNTQIETGCRLEYVGPGDCKLYGARGELLGEVTSSGAQPEIVEGGNTIGFRCTAPSGISARAQVTVATRGKAEAIR